jgi:hypothetical protein
VSVVLRMLDQLLWSFAFFILNAAALRDLTTAGFASFATVTAIGFMAVAVSRAASVNADVISGSRRGLVSTAAASGRVAAGTSVAVGIISASICYALLSVKSGDHVVLLPCFVFLMVCSDIPRQLLVIRGHYAEAMGVSASYVALAVSIAFLMHGKTLVAWASCLLILLALGWSLVVVRSAAQRSVTREGPRLRAQLALEAIYFGLAGQAGLLVLFTLGYDESTAALRISYALAFAPVFSLVQGITPLVVRSVSERLVRGDHRAALHVPDIFAAAVTVLAVVVGVAACVILPRFESADLDGLWLYLPVVGLSLVTAQIMELNVTVARMFGARTRLHAERSAVAGADVLLQVAGAVWMGPIGVASAMTAASIMRALFAVRYRFLGRRLQNQV